MDNYCLNEHVNLELYKNNVIYKIDGGLTAYCLLFANPNIHQNTGKFMCFLNRRENLTYLSSYVCFWYTKIGTV